MRRSMLVLALLLSGASAAAQAACVLPSPPPQADRPVKPAAPEKPRCAASNSCDNADVQAFNKAVAAFNARGRDYMRDAQAYADRLNAYVAEAEAYAKCEVREMGL